jgi:hypothetical protein
MRRHSRAKRKGQGARQPLRQVGEHGRADGLIQRGVAKRTERTAIAQKQQLRPYRRAAQAGQQCPCATPVEVRLQSSVQVKGLGVRGAEWFEAYFNCPSARQPEFPGLLIPKRQLNEMWHLGG